jgi:uncharacterized membrane protein
MTEASTVATAEEEGPSELPRLIHALILFAALGMMVGLGGWLLRAGEMVPPYLLRNEITREGRIYILADMAGGAIIGCLLALGYLFWKRAPGVPALLRTAWLLSPLIPAGLVPMMLHWQLWQNRMLAFLVLTAVIGLAFYAFTAKALEQPLPAVPARVAALFGRLPRPLLPARLARALPMASVFLMALGYAAFFAYRTLEMHHNLRTAAFDLGLEENLVWNALHLGKPFKSAPLGGPHAIHFGYHATPFAYVLAPIYAIYQHAETLLVVQALLIGGAAIPLFLFAKRYVSPWAAALVAGVYVCNPAVHGTNLYDFHYLPLGPFFLWLSLYALEARKNILSVIAVVLTLSVREDVGAGLAVIGAYLVLSGRRPRAGALVALVGGLYVVLLKLVLMPMALSGSQAFVGLYRGLLPPGESNFGGVLKTALGNPAFTMVSLLEEKKLVYVLQIFVPLAFLPLRRPIGLLCVLPGFVFTLLSTGYDPLIELGFQYPAHWNAYLFIALVANLAWAGRPRHPSDTFGPARRRAWLVALAVSTLIASYHYGVFFQSNVARAGFGIANFGTTVGDREAMREVRELVLLIPPRARVVASERLVPHISNRPDAYTLRVGLFDADYLLFDTRSIGNDERTFARKAFDSEKFGVVEILGPFVLAKRGLDSPRTAEIAAKVR